MDVGALNALFAIPGHLFFETGEGGLTRAVVDNPFARCEIFLQGAHVTSFHPHDADELLWMSRSARFEPGRAIRGGVPLCWPWFGPHPDDAALPQHGFARTAAWTLFGTTINGRGETVLRFGLQDGDASRKLFPHAFTLEYAVTVGRALNMELTTRNDGETPLVLTQALHTYLRVGDIGAAGIEGLEGKRYADKVEEGATKLQEGRVRITSEVDRVYEDADPSCRLADGERTVELSKSGSGSTVVWNPWRDKAAAMADFDDEGYRRMVCIETANAGSDRRVLEPGESHTIAQIISQA